MTKVTSNSLRQYFYLFLSIFVIWVQCVSLHAQSTKLRGSVLEGKTRKPIAARVYLQGPDGKFYFAQSGSPDGNAIVYQRQTANHPNSIEHHVTLSAHPFEFEVSPGQYRLRVERGKEYLPFEKAISVDQGTSEVTVELPRWIDMAARGWFSGDTHSHRALEEVPNLVLAEDLNIAFPLSYWVTTAGTGAVDGNRVKISDLAARETRVDSTHLIYPLNTEYELFRVGDKPHTLGAFVVIGHRHPINDPVPPVGPLAAKVHAEGALIDLEKHSWPWSILIVPIMRIDLFELANNHVWQTEFGFPKWTLEAAGKYMNLEMSNDGFTEWGWIDFGFQTYYALLNCGFRLQPTAGTASGVHPVPLGFGRVYVEIEGEFSSQAWLAGLRAGRSFVTNGPLLDVKFNGQSPGHIFPAANSSFSIRTQGKVYSLSRVSRVDVMVNGRIIRTLQPVSVAREAGGYESQIDETVSVDASSWLAVRVFESEPQERIRFAHSSPVHVEISAKPLLPSNEQIEYLVGRVEQEIARSQAVINAESLAEYRRALDFYRDIAGRVRAASQGSK